MTDNEKRAHDFALRAMSLAYDFQTRFIDKNQEKVNINLYEIYKENYDDVLSELNSD